VRGETPVAPRELARPAPWSEHPRARRRSARRSCPGPTVRPRPRRAAAGRWPCPPAGARPQPRAASTAVRRRCVHRWPATRALTALSVPLVPLNRPADDDQGPDGRPRGSVSHRAATGSAPPLTGRCPSVTNVRRPRSRRVAVGCHVAGRMGGLHVLHYPRRGLFSAFARARYRGVPELCPGLTCLRSATWARCLQLAHPPAGPRRAPLGLVVAPRGVRPRELESGGQAKSLWYIWLPPQYGEARSCSRPSKPFLHSRSASGMP